MTYIGKFNKLLRQICQLETNNYYSNAQILDQFITEDLNSAIQYAKRYEMAIEKTNCTKLKTAQQLRKKLTNSQKKLKTISLTNNNSNPKDINHHKDEIKTTLHHFLITSLRIAITVETLATEKEIAESYNETNKIEQSYYQPLPPLAYYLPRPQYQNNYYQPTPQTIQQQYQQPPTQHYQVPTQRLSIQSQFTPQNRYQVNNNRISSSNQLVPRNSTQPKSNHYHTQPSYLTMSEEQDFHHTVPSEGRAAAQQQNLSYTPTTISPARIAENANLSDIFSFEFEANKSPFLLSNVAANEQKAIMAMYTKAEVEGKTICLILDINATVEEKLIVTADGMKKTSVEEIDNFPFTLDGITIPVKVLVIDAPQYQALTQELTISYQGQHTRVPATCGIFNKHSEKAPAFEFELEEEKPLFETFMALGSTSNWADETEQEHFTLYSEPETSRWNIPYSKPEPKKQCPYIPLKCKDCHKKLSSMRACISPEEKYENHTCYYCKACHRE
ncbi:hypothetical protein G9A89_001596 [Geosiphon pyriformis]|nr:hypothetical protein G9A89_001596 [Geosiphon pyriformis]